MEVTKLDDSNIEGIVVSEGSEGLTTSGQTPVLSPSLVFDKLVGISWPRSWQETCSNLPLAIRILETNTMLLVLEAHK